MNLEVLLIASHAWVDNSLLNVTGGGWENYSCSFFPSTITGSLCGVFTIEESELDSSPAVSVSMTAQDGQDLGFAASMIVASTRPPTTPGVPIRIPFAVPFTFAVSAPTIVKAAVVYEGAELAGRPFEVRGVVPDAPPTPLS